MVSRGDQDTLVFFSISYWGRWLMIGWLTAVFGFTAAHAIWRLALPGSTLSGTVIAVTETKYNSRSAAYTVTLQTGESAQTAITLRNNGRILRALDNGVSQTQPVNLKTRRGTAIALTLPDGTTIRETAVSPLIQLLLSLIPLLLLLFHLGADLIEWGTGKRRQ